MQSLDSLLMSSSISSPCLPLWVTTSLLIAPGPFQCVFMQIKANVNLSIYLPLSHKRYHLSRCHSLPDFCHVAIHSRYLLTQYMYFFSTAAWYPTEGRVPVWLSGLQMDMWDVSSISQLQTILQQPCINFIPFVGSYNHRVNFQEGNAG